MWAGNLIGMIFMCVHIPGWHVASALLQEGSSLEMPTIIFVTSIIWSLLTFVLLSLRKSVLNTAK